MEPKKRRKTKGTVIIGRCAATVRIYPMIRKNGYPQNTVCWKEGGRRRMRCFACLDEAKMVAQQISVRLERELRELMAGAWTAMRAALDAAAHLVTLAAGGTDAVMKLPFARRHLHELARYHSGPPLPATSESRMAHLSDAWRDIDAAVAAVPEIKLGIYQK